MTRRAKRSGGLVDRAALRGAVRRLEGEEPPFGRAALNRLAEVLDEAAQPGLRNLASLSAHAARKRRSEIVEPQDVAWARSYIDQNGLSQGEYKGAPRPRAGI